MFWSLACSVDPRHGAAPVGGCTCGVYAFTSETDTRVHIRATQLLSRIAIPLRARGIDPEQAYVLGRVLLSTDFVVAKRPPESATVELKASAAQIVRLFVDNPELGEALTAAYQVPVSVDEPPRAPGISKWV
ncbi:hypothetical protein [Mycobacterium marseillense]|uniref:hypothetical protein n=1 Tax=Mycobacterium marseillense TaxID=701042 RepID=UPI0011A6CB83|nr:hypothetical protein [Mycobacterium marseillense]